MAEDKQDKVDQEKLNQVTVSQLAEQSIEALQKKWSTSVTTSKGKPVSSGSVGKPDTGIKPELIQIKFIDLLDQRNTQRGKIFDLAKSYCWTSLIFVMTIVAFQIAMRVSSPYIEFNVFSNNELQIIVTGVFVQFIGLLYIITRSLYNEKDYKDIYKDIYKK